MSALLKKGDIIYKICLFRSVRVSVILKFICLFQRNGKGGRGDLRKGKLGWGKRGGVTKVFRTVNDAQTRNEERGKETRGPEEVRQKPWDGKCVLSQLFSPPAPLTCSSCRHLVFCKLQWRLRLVTTTLWRSEYGWMPHQWLRWRKLSSGSSWKSWWQLR